MQSKHRGVEQLVARRAHNPEAGGSSPSPATTEEKSKGFSSFFYAHILSNIRENRTFVYSGSSNDKSRNLMNKFKTL